MSTVGRSWFDLRMLGVVLGALVVDGRVLLGLRGSTKHARPDVWDLPGGVIEAGESELDALARELHEELGVLVTTDSVSHLCRATVGRSEEQVHLSVWLVREWKGTPANLAPEEHVDLGWFSIQELPLLAGDIAVRDALVNALTNERR